MNNKVMSSNIVKIPKPYSVLNHISNIPHFRVMASQLRLEQPNHDVEQQQDGKQKINKSNPPILDLEHHPPFKAENMNVSRLKII